MHLSCPLWCDTNCPCVFRRKVAVPEQPVKCTFYLPKSFFLRNCKDSLPVYELSISKMRLYWLLCWRCTAPSIMLTDPVHVTRGRGVGVWCVAAPVSDRLSACDRWQGGPGTLQSAHTSFHLFSIHTPLRIFPKTGILRIFIFLMANQEILIFNPVAKDLGGSWVTRHKLLICMTTYARGDQIHQ